MKKTVGWNVVVVLFLLSITACKSEYERIRLSGDPQMILDKGLGYYEDREYLKAQGLFELVLPAYRGKKELEDIYFKYAYSYYYLGQYILASYYFNNFSNTFSTSLLREEADFMAAYSNFKLSPSFRLDQSYSEQAIEGFQLFVNTYPDSDRVEECNRLIEIMRKKMEKKAFAAAALYYDLRQYQAATQSFENLLKDFPETENAEQVRYMIVKSAYLLADNSIFEKRRERYKEAEKYASEFVAKFAGSDNVKEVQIILDDCQQKLKSFQDGGYQKQGTGARS